MLPGPYFRSGVRLRPDAGLDPCALWSHPTPPPGSHQAPWRTSCLECPTPFPAQDPRGHLTAAWDWGCSTERGCLSSTYFLTAFAGAAVSFSNSSFSEKITTLSVGKREGQRGRVRVGSAPSLPFPVRFPSAHLPGHQATAPQGRSATWAPTCLAVATSPGHGARAPRRAGCPAVVTETDTRLGRSVC